MNPPADRLPPETHIGHAELQIADLARSEQFYEGMLGFRAVKRVPGRLLLSATGSPPVHLALVERPGARTKPPRTTGLFHIAIRYPTRPALARALQRLVDLGWPLQGFSDHRVSEAIYLSDPDGLGLELYVDRPRDQWPRRGGRIAMTTEPLDIPDLMATLEDPAEPGDEIDPGADIGHVHLQVPGLAEARRFYHDDLGLDVTQEDYAGALFLSAGGYHHHLGLNTWAVQAAPRPPEDAVGLRSFALRMPADAVEHTAARLRRAGYQVWEETVEGPGFRVEDPQGIGVLLLS